MIARGPLCVRSPAMGSKPDGQTSHGLSLAPLRGLRPRVDSERLGRLLSPPYDVIDPTRRPALLNLDPDNVVSVVLPEPSEAGYAGAASRLESWVHQGLF